LFVVVVVVVAAVAKKTEQDELGRCREEERKDSQAGSRKMLLNLLLGFT
jgi:hypothetical protein